jgi:hypothetical protein
MPALSVEVATAANSASPRTSTTAAASLTAAFAIAGHAVAKPPHAAAAATIGERLHRQAPGRAEVAGDVQPGIEVVGANHCHRPHPLRVAISERQAHACTGGSGAESLARAMRSIMARARLSHRGSPSREP